MIETREGYGELVHRCLAVKALAQGPFDVEGPITLEDSESRLEVFTRFVKIAQEIGPHLEWFQEREGGESVAELALSVENYVTSASAIVADDKRAIDDEMFGAGAPHSFQLALQLALANVEVSVARRLLTAGSLL